MKLLLVFFPLVLGAHLSIAKPIELALDWKPEPEFGGFYAAQVEGSFKRRLLDVKIIPGGAGSPTIQVAAAGKTDFAIASAEEVLISRSQGSDIVAIFSVYQIFPRIIMSHAERKFESLREVFESPGVIAIQKGLPFFSFLERKYGKPKAKVVPYLGGVANFYNDSNYSQQAFIHSEPILAQNRGARITTFKVADEGYNPYSTVMVTRKAFFEKNPELVKSMVAAVREGWQRYLDQPDKTNDFMHVLNPSMDVRTFTESAAAQKDLIAPKNLEKTFLGKMTLERWRDLAQQLKSMNLLKSELRLEDVYFNF